MADRREPMARPAGVRRSRRLLWTLLALAAAITGGVLLALGGITLLRHGRAASPGDSTGEPSAAVVAVSATNVPRLLSPTPLASVTPPPGSLPPAVTPTPTLYLTATHVPPPEGLDAPVAPPGEAAFGEFELGGAVDGRIRHNDEMIEAGMAWVAYELAWEPDLPAASARALIEEGRRNGFKVLLSVVSARQRPQALDTPAFIEFLRGVAYYGPDAIEVWAEPNVATRWPAGELSGATYVQQILAPAYNAIKSVNSNIMVISGAPAPPIGVGNTGDCGAGGACRDTVFLDQMLRAGGATYFDCLGAQYVQGATAPGATGGHPGTEIDDRVAWYFGDALDAYVKTGDHRVCFTRFGYLSGQSYGGVPATYSWARGTGAVDQGRWLAEAARLSAESDAVRLMIVWNVDYLTWDEADPRAGYAIVRPDNTCPACDVLGTEIP